MSVIIKEFDMPKKCSECQISKIDFNGNKICGIKGFNISGAARKHPECPLKPVKEHET